MTLAYAHDDRTNSTAYMFGRDSFYDGPCARSYNPHEHAMDLGIPLIYRTDLPDPEMVACYSLKHRAIFVRPSLHSAVERCALAHEIVHHEYGDAGHARMQERRADRLAARRLIMPRDVYALADITDDAGRMAMELDVTEHIMTIFLREFAHA